MKKFRPLLIISILMLSAILLCSCGATGVEYYSDDSASGTSESILYKSSSDVPDETDVTERKIIRTVEETVETTAFDDFMTALEKAISSSGGYSSEVNLSGNSYGEDEDRSARIEICIPAEKLDDFIGEIGNLGAVTYYSESADDVTEAYVDVESRIAVLEAEEKTLLSLIEKAESVADMLAVREQLTEVQEDLAALRAQKKSYDQRISYSTVNLRVYEVDYVMEDEGFFSTVGSVFMSSLSGLGTLLKYIGIVILGGAPYILFFVGIPLAIILTIYFVNRKKKNNRK